jgi:predicted alpha/beta-hydrolase family hydrolase
MTAKALLITPGAGADRNQATLVALAEAVAPLPVERVDFPYRLAGKKMPDKPPVAVAHLVKEAAALTKRARTRPQNVVLGGRSYGGRMCSLAVAEGLPAAGLVLLSYPLHPPGKPQNLRTEHFPLIDVPVLFVSGDKDPFGTPEEFAEHVTQIKGPVTQVWVPGNHSPRNNTPVVEAVVAWLTTL